MSREFIKKGVNSQDLNKAATQEAQLSYFTQSDLQDNNITEQYLSAWAERQFVSSDYFLNYVKSVFKTTNFLYFFKYLRKPIPSTKIINNKIKPQLNRVFTSENSEFKYNVSNVDEKEIKETLNKTEFQEELFNKLLFSHNSILIHELDSNEINKPYRYFVDIDKVISLEHDNNRITKIAYPCSIYIEDQVSGIMYIDDDQYVFYDNEYSVIAEAQHDLGICPADFICKSKYKDNFIVRESLFTYIREELEEYNFLKTLQKMTEPNGAIPIITKLDADEETADIDSNSGELAADNIMGSQRANVYNEINNQEFGTLEAGTEYAIPIEAVKEDDGKINMDLVKNYINFFYTPVEALNYIKNRITEIENSIISTVIGTIDTSNEESKNELQIEKSIIVLENTLIKLSSELSYICNKSDYKLLALKYGKDRVNEVFNFYGTDFFLESQTKLFADLEKANNPIERKNILTRINQNKYKNNRDQMLRQELLYDLLPYVSDVDFDKALSAGMDDITKQYQLRFNYWISQFEARYGDIVVFYYSMEFEDNTRLKIVNDLILDIINNKSE